MSRITRAEIMRVDHSEPEDARHAGKPIKPNALVLEQLRRMTDLSFQMDRPNPVQALGAVLLENCVNATDKDYRSFYRYGEKTSVHSNELKVKFRDECYRLGIGVAFTAEAGLMVLFNDDGIFGYWSTAWSESVTNFRFTLVAPYEVQDLFTDFATKNLRQDRPKAVRRIYLVGDNLRSRTELVQDHDICPTVVATNYPYFDFKPEDLWFEFAESSSHVLPLLGPAGTGKSTYARALLDARGWDNRIYLIDSVQVLKHPGLMDYVRGLPLGSVVICEDADILLGKRTEGNEVMSTFLNTTSGIATRDIKFIVLTNLPTVDKMDDAIVRAGRNHRTMPFRELTLAEAVIVRENMQLPPLPEDTGRTKWSLAEVIHYKSDMPIKRLFGFNRT